MSNRGSSVSSQSGRKPYTPKLVGFRRLNCEIKCEHSLCRYENTYTLIILVITDTVWALVKSREVPDNPFDSNN